MPDEPLHQPHDKLFKSGFGDPLNAAAFLSAQLPPALSAAIDWPRLRTQSGSFVDSQFRRSESDLLFSAPLHGRECLIYLLFEHQRTCDPWIALRLLRYMVRIWEEFIKAHAADTALPVIVPVVLAQNVERWELSTKFSALLDLPQTADALAAVPDFAFRLIQLAELPFDKIVGTPAGILVLRTLKAEQMNQLLADELWDEALIERAMPTFEMILRYILDKGEIDKTAFNRRLETLHSAAIKEASMTLAQQFHQEGLQEGRQEGLQLGQILAQQRAVVSALEIRFAQVPPELREQIAQVNDTSRLQTLLAAAICCASLGEFASQP